MASWATLDPTLVLVCPAVCSAAEGSCFAVSTTAAGGAHTLLSWPYTQRLGTVEKLATRSPLHRPALSVHALPGSGQPDAGSRALVVYQDGSASLEPAALNGSQPAALGAASVIAVQQSEGTVAVLCVEESAYSVQFHTCAEVRLGQPWARSLLAK